MGIEVGQDCFRYEVAEGWGRLPENWQWGDVVSIAIGPQDEVFVFNRSEHPLVIFDKWGHFLSAWGADRFVRPHGITMGPDGMLYCTDDEGHIVLKCTPNGAVLMMLGERGKGSDTGYDGQNIMTIARPGGPFNRPTKVAIDAAGDLYISDGYGNCQVHKFSADGRYLFSWGEPGNGPGQFRLPHSVIIDRQARVYVADRENNRVQIFDADGRFLAERPDLRRPNDLALDAEGNLYVASMFAITAGPAGRSVLKSYISILSPDGMLLSRWGTDDACTPGSFWAAHGIAMDSRGGLYVGEIITRPGRGPAPEGCHALQKFVRIS